MRDINDYTGMTRVEFLKGIKTDSKGRIYELHGIEGAVYICPEGFGLGDCQKCNCKCKECWKEAIKNIKFKED